MEIRNQNYDAVTHGGTFHADEVFATVILEKVFGDLTVMRTFKLPDQLDEGAIVYDIGGGAYDHHQKGGNGTRTNGVPYAAAGLIWDEFGYSLISQLGVENPDLVWRMIDRDLIQGVDAVDNGVMPAPEYPANVMNVSQIISGFNPLWDDASSSDGAFIEAVKFAHTIFDNVLANAISKAKAQKIVDEWIENADGNVMVMDKFVPWQEFLFTSEAEKASKIQFVIFPSNRGGWNWQCVPDAPGSFSHRKSVPVEWRGLSEDELRKVTGVAGATFCHPAGFIGGAESFEDALALAKIAAEA